MTYGSREDGTACIELTVAEQAKLAEQRRDQPTEIIKITGSNVGYFKLSVVLTPIDNPFWDT